MVTPETRERVLAHVAASRRVRDARAGARWIRLPAVRAYMDGVARQMEAEVAESVDRRLWGQLLDRPFTPPSLPAGMYPTEAFHAVDQLAADAAARQIMVVSGRSVGRSELAARIADMAEHFGAAELRSDFTSADVGETWPPPGHPLHSTLVSGTRIESVTEPAAQPGNRKFRRQAARRR